MGGISLSLLCRSQDMWVGSAVMQYLQFVLRSSMFGLGAAIMLIDMFCKLLVWPWLRWCAPLSELKLSVFKFQKLCTQLHFGWKNCTSLHPFDNLSCRIRLFSVVGLLLVTFKSTAWNRQTEDYASEPTSQNPILAYQSHSNLYSQLFFKVSSFTVKPPGQQHQHKDQQSKRPTSDWLKTNKVR